jgi:hypothetical protein
MQQITDYQIIKTTDAGQLAAQVRTGIAEGLQPYGELIIMAVAPYIVYTQPMVRYSTPDENNAEQGRNKE